MIEPAKKVVKNLLQADFKWNVSIQYFMSLLRQMPQPQVLAHLPSAPNLFADEEDPQDWQTLLSQLKEREISANIIELRDPFLEMSK